MTPASYTGRSAHAEKMEGKFFDKELGESWGVFSDRWLLWRLMRQSIVRGVLDFHSDDPYSISDIVGIVKRAEVEGRIILSHDSI